MYIAKKFPITDSFPNYKANNTEKSIKSSKHHCLKDFTEYINDIKRFCLQGG